MELADAQRRSTITAAINRLKELGVSPAVFETSKRLKFGFDDKVFASHVQPIVKAGSLEKAERILLIGFKRGFFPGIRSANLPSLLKFLQFLQTPEGKQELETLANQDKTAKKATGVYSSQEIMAAGFLEQQIHDLHSKAIRLRMEAIVDIKKRKAKLNEDIGAVQNEYLPAHAYQPLSQHELNLRVCNLLVEKFQLEGKKPVLTPKFMQEANDLFGKDVKEEHRIEFIRAGNHMRRLSAYANGRIAQLVAKLDDRNVGQGTD